MTAKRMGLSLDKLSGLAKSNGQEVNTLNNFSDSDCEQTLNIFFCFHIQILLSKDIYKSSNNPLVSFLFFENLSSTNKCFNISWTIFVLTTFVYMSLCNMLHVSIFL